MKGKKMPIKMTVTSDFKPFEKLSPSVMNLNKTRKR